MFDDKGVLPYYAPLTKEALMTYTIKDVSTSFRVYSRHDGGGDDITEEAYEIVDEDGLVVYRSQSYRSTLEFCDLLNRDRVMSSR